MSTQTIMAGKWEMSIGNVLIPAELLGELSISYEEGTSEADTQAGTITTPNGKAETAEATTTIYLPSFDYLKNIYSDVYNTPTGQDTSGNVIFGAGSCQTQTPVEVNIHPVCESNDNNDIHFAALIAHTFDLTLSTSDPVSIETTMYLQPTDEGRLRVGTGDLTQESYWDVTTEKTKPVEYPSA